MVFVWIYRGPAIDVGNAANAAKIADDRELLLLIEIVAYVVEMDLTMLGGARILYEHADGNWCPCSFAKNVSFFLPALLTRCPCISAQMEYLEVRELAFQASAHTICCGALKPTGIANVGHNASFTDTI